MRQRLDGLEELVLRQAPADVVQWIEAYAEPGDAGMLFDRWAACRTYEERGQALGVISRRGRIINDIARTLVGTAGHVDLPTYIGCCGIRRLIRDGLITIEPYECGNVHIDSIDLRLGYTRWVRPRDRRVIRPSAAKRNDNDLFEPIMLSAARPLRLVPGATAIAETLESISLAPHVGLRFDNLSSQARFHLRVVQAEHVHAGSQGTVMLEFVNEGDDEIVLYPEDTVAQAFVYLVVNNHSGYGLNAIPLPAGSHAGGGCG